MSPVPINPTRTGGGYRSRRARGAPFACAEAHRSDVAGAHRSIYRCDRRPVRTYTPRAMSQIGPLLSPLLVGRDDLLTSRIAASPRPPRATASCCCSPARQASARPACCRRSLRKARDGGVQGRRGRPRPQDLLVPLGSILDLARTMRMTAGFRRASATTLRPARDGGASDTLATRRLLVHDLAERIIDAIDGPPLLAFEDLQWADELSLEVIGELARLVRDRPILLIAAYRHRRAADRHHPPRVAGAPAEPALRGGGAARAADLRADGPGHHADPRHGPAGAARRGRRRLRADRRHPAPHRGAARRARRGRAHATIGRSATRRSRRRSRTRSWRGSPACRPRPGRSPAPAPSSAAASCPTSSPASWTSRSPTSTPRSRS